MSEFHSFIENNQGKLCRFIQKLIREPNNIKLCGYQHYNSLLIELIGQKAEDISKHGFVMSCEACNYVYINEKQPSHQKIYTLAHEIGHIVLHHLTNNTEQPKIDMEWEANFFAAIFMFAVEGALPYMRYHVTNTEGGVCKCPAEKTAT